MDKLIKEKILEVSRRLFGRFGYKKTTIEDIAQEAGIGKGSIYLYFKSKEEILFTLIKRSHEAIIGEWIKIVNKNFLPREKISAMLKCCITTIQAKKKEISLDTLPAPLLKSVLKMSEETRSQRLALLSTVLDTLCPDTEREDRQRDKLAGILLDFMSTIIFRLDADRGFAWEEYFDHALKLLLREPFLSSQ